MEKNVFIDKVHAIDNNIGNRESKKLAGALAKDFNFVSANLSNFLPAIPQEQHWDLYVELMRNRSLAVFHSELTQLADRMETRGDLGFLETVGKKPYIFCNYHLGSYRALLGFLVNRKIDFALLLDNRTFSEQGDKIRASIASLQQHAQHEVSFDLFNVENPAAMMHIGQWIKAGKSLVAYLDGNTGYGGIKSGKQEVYAQLEFMGMPISSRKGIATLSYITNVPIIPAISYFEDREAAPVLDFHPPVIPYRETPRETWVTDTLQQLYTILENKLRQYPLQWEAWLYVHKFIDMETLQKRYAGEKGDVAIAGNEDAELSFNKSLYGLFLLDETPYLFNRRTYITYEINEPVFSTLQQLAAKESMRRDELDISDSSMGQLLALNVLSPCLQNAGTL